MTITKKAAMFVAPDGSAFVLLNDILPFLGGDLLHSPDGETFISLEIKSASFAPETDDNVAETVVMFVEPRTDFLRALHLYHNSHHDAVWCNGVGYRHNGQESTFDITTAPDGQVTITKR
jgi:hypothetical protein